ncbi:MAG: response regulator [Halomonadaceae bacterium]|nr:MAG: response regulator [Halomonadaceae bacterium]
MDLERVLYVEDDKSIQAVAQLALETVGGLQVCICSSGEEALDKGPGFSPQLILLDVMMPGMDGPETLIQMRQLPALAKVPVVFMTARTQESEVQGYLAQGAMEVIPKPFDPMQLANQVRAIWTDHR